ncbi:MAG: hypothetical protein AAFX09_10190 [Pseudomonadota bacterium]
MGWIRVIASYLAVTLATAVLATMVQTQFVISALKGVGAEVSLGDRLSMTLADLAGLAPLFGVILAIALGAAFLAAALAGRFAPIARTLVFAAAGAVAFGVMLFLMEQVFFGVQVIAGARFTFGFIAQMACGALAGALYARLTPPPAARAA